jgi:5-oxoprolinase (ATP-hydrolysing)/N-methylhydantoinase A
VVEDVGTGGLLVVDRTDRVVELQLSGGAGYGDPLKRSVSSVDDDVREGRVSAEAAETAAGRERGADSAAGPELAARPSRRSR